MNESLVAGPDYKIHLRWLFHRGVVIWIKIIDGSRLHNRLTKAFPLVRSRIDTNFILSGFGSNHNRDNTEQYLETSHIQLELCTIDIHTGPTVETLISSSF